LPFFVRRFIGLAWQRPRLAWLLAVKLAVDL